MDKLVFIAFCNSLIIKMITNSQPLFLRVALASSIIISIISILLLFIFNLSTVFIINKDSKSFSDSRLAAAFHMHFPSHYIENFHDVEVTNKISRNPTGINSFIIYL